MSFLHCISSFEGTYTFVRYRQPPDVLLILVVFIIYSFYISRYNCSQIFRTSISNDLTQMVDFPTPIPDCDSHSPALLDFFLSSDASICSTMAFPPLGNSGHVVVSVSIDFPTNS